MSKAPYEMSLRWIVWMALSSAVITQSRAQKRVMCYYANWNEERNTSYRLLPRNIDPELCTHIVYAFILPDLAEGIPMDFLSNLDDGSEMMNMKKANPQLKFMLSIGGWDFGSLMFSKIAADPQLVMSCAMLLSQNMRSAGFHGLDVNWQWPGSREGSNSADKTNYRNMIKMIKDHFVEEARESGEERLILSVVLPPFNGLVKRGFDIRAIAKEVDFFNLHTMDYYLPTDPLVNHLAPLYIPAPNFNSEYTVDATVSLYLKYGLDPQLMNLGIPLYGNSYLLLDPSSNTLEATADEEGMGGFGTGKPGTLAFFEICTYVKNEKWSVEHPNRTALGPYAYHNRNWVAFDDSDIVRRKVRYAVGQNLGGITLWTIDMDDFNGLCNERFQLTKAAMDTVHEMTSGGDRYNVVEPPADQETAASDVREPYSLLLTVSAPPTNRSDDMGVTMTINNRTVMNMSTDGITMMNKSVKRQSAFFTMMPGNTGVSVNIDRHAGNDSTASNVGMSISLTKGLANVDGLASPQSQVEFVRPTPDRAHVAAPQRGPPPAPANVFRTNGSFSYKSKKVQKNRNYFNFNRIEEGPGDSLKEN